MQALGETPSPPATVPGRRALRQRGPAVERRHCLHAPTRLGLWGPGQRVPVASAARGTRCAARPVPEQDVKPVNNSTGGNGRKKGCRGALQAPLQAPVPRFCPGHAVGTFGFVVAFLALAQ